MHETIVLAKRHGVVIGAHPGYADRANFGRRELPIEPGQVYLECVYQIGALVGLARSEQVSVAYVKPHGGLYHQANREPAYADAVIAAAMLFDLMVMGIPGSQLERRSKGLREFIAEGFADRRYRENGELVPQCASLSDRIPDCTAQKLTDLLPCNKQKFLPSDG